MAESTTNPKQDNLQKAIGISRGNANKMDFFDLMKHLPQDVKRNIGGQVKDAPRFRASQIGDSNLYDMSSEEWQDRMGVTYMDDYHHVSEAQEAYHRKYDEEPATSHQGLSVSKHKVGSKADLAYHKRRAKVDKIKDKMDMGHWQQQESFIKDSSRDFLNTHKNERYVNRAEAERGFYNFLGDRTINISRSRY